MSPAEPDLFLYQETAHRAVETGGVQDEVDVEGERDRIESGALAYLKANPECDVKMVFLVRTCVNFPQTPTPLSSCGAVHALD